MPTFIIVDHRVDTRTAWVVAPPGHYRQADGKIARDKSCPLTSGPEWTFDSPGHAYRFRSHRAAARVANRCGATATIQPAP